MLDSGEVLENWRLPEWFSQYRGQLKSSLLDWALLSEYCLYHDCGKPYCLVQDESGRRHFPNHARVNYETWIGMGGDTSVGKLILMDMQIHQMKSADIDEFIKHPEAVSLLLTGLAEIHANGQMFGGLDSDSFRIKFSQINKRGKAICKKLFTNVIIN